MGHSWMLKEMKKRRLVFGEGPKPCDVALIGQQPGRHEDARGRVFIGMAGAVMNVSLFHAGLHRSDMWVSNIYKSYLGRDAKGNDIAPTDEQLQKHLPFLEDELDEVNPKIIGTIGRLATRHFLGDVAMDAVHGVPHRVGERVIVPIVHPAAGFHDEKMAVWSYWDIKQLGLVVEGKIKPVTIGLPTVNSHLVAGPRTIDSEKVAVDTEGTIKHPFCLSYSTNSETASVLECPLAFEIPEGKVVMHYAVHDMRVLRTMGVDIDDWDIEDTMVLAYVLGVEPKGLKALARRHLHYDMRDYEDVVGPYHEAAAIRYLVEAQKTDWGVPEPRLRQDSKTRKMKVYQPQLVNKRITSLIKSYQKGTACGFDKWWKNLLPDIREPIEAKHGVFPSMSTSLQYLPEEERTPYAGTDAAATYDVHGILWDRVRGLGLEDTARMDMAIIPYIERMESNGVVCDVPFLKKFATSLEIQLQDIERSVSKEYNVAINLGSGDQVADLLYKKLKLRAPCITQGGKRGSTDKKALESLRSEHPVIDSIRRYRAKARLLSFAQKLPSFASAADMRVRGRVKYTNVVSGRFSMSDPNMQQIPSRTEEGREIRNGFIASGDNVFLSCDYDQLEMKIMAHLANDKTLVDIIKSGEDVHYKTAELMFGTIKGNVTKGQRTAIKNVNYGVIYGIGAKGLHGQLTLAGIEGYDEDDCARLLREWYRLYPGVDDFIQDTKLECRRKGYVRSMWGRIRWLPTIYSPVNYIKYKAEREAVSHRISSTATDIIKRAMARLWPWMRRRWQDGYTFEPLLQIHDELLFEAESRMKLMAPTVQRIMCRDSKEFRVPITTASSSGRRWGELK